MVVQFGYNAYSTNDLQGRVSGITTGQMKQTLSFDPASGNLMSRDYRIVNNPSGLTEDFEYDQLNRLIKSVVTGQDSIMAGYSPNGNITSKSDAGSYTYDATQINAVTDISGNSGSINLSGQTIEYNSFNLTTNIVEGDSSYSILYNPLNQRIKTVYSSQPGSNVTKYYSGSYEKTVTSEVTKETHYICSPFGLVAIIVKQGGTVQTYFAETDHLGSIIGLLNADKSYAERASFDAWGRRRNPTDWTYNNIPQPVVTTRGFTCHEHLDQFGLINMNGRMYDPILGRFHGVDPLLQSPDFSQSFNGYSYCLNNPLKYRDQSGYTAAVVEIDPINYAKFIAQVLYYNLDWLADIYKSNEYPTVQDYLHELESHNNQGGIDLNQEIQIIFSYNIVVPPIKQNYTNWCIYACAESLSRYFGGNTSQQTYAQTFSGNQNNNMSYWGEFIASTMTYHSLKDGLGYSNHPSSISALVASLEECNPILSRVDLGNGPHAIIIIGITGYSDGSVYLRYMNPDPEKNNYSFMSYQEYRTIQFQTISVNGMKY